MICLFRYHEGELFCPWGWQNAHWFLSRLVYFWSAVAIPSEDCAWFEENHKKNTVEILFYCNLVVFKKVTTSFNNAIYLRESFRSPFGPYVPFIWNCYVSRNPGPLFTKKTPSYGYRDPHYKPKTVWRPSQVYNGNPHTDNLVNRGPG